MSKEIEQALLGTIMLYKDYQDIIVNSLTTKMFYLPEHRIIFNVIEKINKDDKPADMISVVSALTKEDLQKVGGGYYISSLTTVIGSGYDYDNNIRLLKQEYIKRGLVEMFQKETDALLNNDRDIAESYRNVSTGLEDLFNISDTDVNNMYDIMSERINEIEKIKPGELIGISSGIRSLDKVTNGWQDGDLIILAARPSMGKTIVSNLLAKTPALQGKTILYFSLEMPSKRIADRIISLDTGINSKKLQSNNLRSDDWINIEDNVFKYKDVKFLINDESGLTIEQISNISLIESKKNKVDLILIDYLGLIKFSHKTGSTNDQVTHISKNLKGLAKKLEVPLIALSQLSRSVESRSDKRPVMSDLRDSGSIEQDADIVAFLYRDDYYNPESEDQLKIEVLIRKNRNGEIGMTYLYRNASWSSIRDEEVNEIPDIFN